MIKSTQLDNTEAKVVSQSLSLHSGVDKKEIMTSLKAFQLKARISLEMFEPQTQKTLHICRGRNTLVPTIRPKTRPNPEY